MVKSRRGASRFGCLLLIVIVVAIGYYALGVGKIAWNYYLFQDRMNTEARFAAHRTDAAIRQRISEFADSLDLPEGANRVTVKRGNHVVYIFSDYYERLEFPLYAREIHLSPSATGAF